MKKNEKKQTNNKRRKPCCFDEPVKPNVPKIYPETLLSLPFWPGLHIIAGRPTSGKTTTVQKIIMHCIKRGLSVAVDNIDQTESSFMCGLLAVDAPFSADDVEKGTLPTDVKNVVSRHRKEIEKNVQFFKENSLVSLLEKVEPLCKKGLKVLVIDFVQRLWWNDRTIMDAENMLAILSHLAQKHHISVIVTSMLPAKATSLPSEMTMHAKSVSYIV